MLTHRTLRRDFHAWWQGWVFLLVVVGLFAWAGSCYQSFQRERRSNAEYRRAVREKRTPEDEEKLKARAKYLEAATEAARRGPPHFVEIIDAGQTMEWLHGKKDAPFERFEGWHNAVEPQGVKYRYFWVGSNGSRGFLDHPGERELTWEESLRRGHQSGEYTVKFRIENRDTKPLTLKVWWIDGERPRKTRRLADVNHSDAAAAGQTNAPQGTTGQERKARTAEATAKGPSWMPKYMRERSEKGARETEPKAAPQHGETWSGTVVAVLASPMLDVAGEDGRRTIDCKQAAVYFGEKERSCIDVKPGDVVLVTYPEKPSGVIKVSVVARPAG